MHGMPWKERLAQHLLKFFFEREAPRAGVEVAADGTH